MSLRRKSLNCLDGDKLLTFCTQNELQAKTYIYIHFELKSIMTLLKLNLGTLNTQTFKPIFMHLQWWIQDYLEEGAPSLKAKGPNYYFG